MTYPEVVSRLAARGKPLTVCWGCELEEGRAHRPARGRLSHVEGWVDITGRIHFVDRRLNRPGLYRFLKFAARSMAGTSTAQQGYRVWVESTLAYDLGLEIRIRFPREYAATERALVRSWLANFGERIDKETRRKMARWAQD